MGRSHKIPEACKAHAWKLLKNDKKWKYTQEIITNGVRCDYEQKKDNNECQEMRKHMQSQRYWCRIDNDQNKWRGSLFLN